VTTGIHVEISIGDPDTCQVAPKSQGGKTISGVTRCPHPEEEGTVIQEFTVPAESDRIEFDGGISVSGSDTRTVFSSGSKEIFRITRPTPQPCVCETIEDHGCPVRDITAVDGTIYVTFVATDHGTLQTILEKLSNRYDKMDLQRALRSSDSTDSQRLTIIDVGAMTERQREVLATAHEAGYFEHPKEASAAEVAAELGIARSTFTEHLAAAQRNLLDELLA
jgi:predicted DNA binding protein